VRGGEHGDCFVAELAVVALVKDQSHTAGGRNGRVE
jgi:hypothetical protein